MWQGARQLSFPHERPCSRTRHDGYAFVNCTGLDDGPDADTHLTTAYDIALMSCELLKHDEIKEYTTIWMDTVRNGQFGLSNTNKLVRFYDGTTGLKTGYTSAAGYCLSASAERGEWNWSQSCCTANLS